MTRINTNVSSLIGRNNLNRANANLSQSLTRLSTGLRINTGKDDPAGLIASENLRSDITAIKKAIGNTDRANQVIATADSALGQVSSLLNDIRGLVTESANAGALSDEQIAANQLQVDSSLEALNRIAQTTTFQGRRLLDGSLDFIKSAGTNFGNLSGLQIDQANLGASGQVDVEVAVSSAATKASVSVDNINAVVPGVASTGTISFADSALTGSASIALPIETTAAVAGAGSLAFTVETAASTQAQGSFQTNATGTLTVDGQTINLVADAAGAAGNATITSVVINGGAGSNNSSIAAGVLTINVTTAIDTTATVADIVSAINNGADGAAGGDDIYTASTTGGATTVTAAGVTGATATNIAGGGTISLDAVDDNLADGIEGNGAKTLTVQYGQAQNNAVYTPGSNTLVVNVTAAEGTATLANIVTSINNGADGAGTGADNDFTATLDAGSGAIRTAAFPANFSLTDQAGVAPTTATRTISLTTNADGDQDFDIQIVSAATADIDDTDPSDGITASIAGNKDTGYTVTIANDAEVDLDTLAAFLQTNIAELDTATINGTATDDLDLRTFAALAPSGQQVVTGSQAQVTNTQAITVTGATANIGLSFVKGTVVGTGTLADRVAVSGNADDGYVITIDDSETVTFGDISDALETIAEIGAGGSATVTPATVFDTDTFDPSVGNTTVAGARTSGSDVITITATEESPEFDGTISFNTTNATPGGITASVVDGNITISVDSTSRYSNAQIVSAINKLDGYSAEVTTAEGSGFFDANDITESTAPTFTALTGGVARTGGLAADAVVQITGTQGSEVFNLKAGTDIATLVDQINLVSDATGVEAAIGEDGTTLEINSVGYGSKAIVDVKVSSEGAGGTFTASLGSGARAEGTDIEATINGIAATGDGNSLSINTATLDLSTSVAAGFTGTAAFSITGGGALFQLGPDVVSNQQARLGIASVNTAALGGVSGKLYQLGSGGTADLAKDPTTAARVVEEAINQVTSLRGRLGAFQRTSLETNKNALNDTLSNLTEAESTIRDADFAEETANLTRSQILVQSGTRVLAIANQNPQNVLGLLG